MELELPERPTMRDIHDYCVRKGLPSLAQGMIELPPPLLLRELAAKYLVREDVHTYRNRWGETDYRQAISGLLKEQSGIDVPVDAILGTQGVTSGIVATCHYLRDFKSVKSVGLLVPFYTYHLKDLQSVFGEDGVRYVKTNDDFSFNYDAIETAMKAGMGGLIVTNPGNPTGLVLDKEDVETLVQLAEDNGCHLIFDECYIDMVYTEKGFYSPIQGGLRSHVIVCRGFSKCLGIQSWRVGYLVAAPSVLPNIMAVHDPVYISVPVLQHAMAEYLSQHLPHFIAHSQKTAALIRRNWEVLSPAFTAAFGWEAVNPQGSMYGVFRHKGASDMEEAIRALKKNVGICPGSIFNPNGESGGFVRIHMGVTEEKADRIIATLSASE